MTVIIFCKTRHYRAAFWVNSQMANQTQKKPLVPLKENISVATEISRHQVLIIPLLFSSQTLVIAHAGVFVSESWLIPTHPPHSLALRSWLLLHVMESSTVDRRGRMLNKLFATSAQRQHDIKKNSRGKTHAFYCDTVILKTSFLVHLQW